MSKVVAITNQKGGVGKTTTAVNLAAAVGEKGKKVLLIDVDPQGNATSGVGINKRDVEASTYELLIGDVKVQDVLTHTAFKNVDLLPSNISLAGAEIELVDLDNRALRLKQGIVSIKSDYDYIFIDCPPSLGLITVNALSAADSILVPIQCEYCLLYTSRCV